MVLTVAKEWQQKAEDTIFILFSVLLNKKKKLSGNTKILDRKVQLNKNGLVRDLKFSEFIVNMFYFRNQARLFQ